MIVLPAFVTDLLIEFVVDLQVKTGNPLTIEVEASGLIASGKPMPLIQHPGLEQNP